MWPQANTTPFTHIVDYTVALETETQPSWDWYKVTDRIWRYKRLRHTAERIYTTSVLCLYFRFDDDNMQYRYILSIIKIISLVMQKK